MNNTLTARIVVRDNASRVVNKVRDRFERLNRTINSMDRNLNHAHISMRRVGTSGTSAGNAVQKSFKGANYEVRQLTQSLNRAIGLYAAFQGVSAMITTSDEITAARNKLNYLNSTTLGESGVTSNEDGATSYSKATLNATNEDLTKMYTSAQKVRTGYVDMMRNVSKSMTLAPDAFQGNMDNAIRFQEIMAEAYTLGGASAAEMSSSMYQMIQALGSGILQGDELRSVREGAPLAYKEIEKFAQGVYNTEESLKDLASQGKITSEIVVAAMMKAGASIDSAFAMTDMTFAQAWTLLKNSTTRAFSPVFEEMNAILNSDTGRKAIEILIGLIEQLADVMFMVVMVAGYVVEFIVNNWGWLKYIIFGLVFALGVLIIALNTAALRAIWAGVQMALGLSIPFLHFIAIAALIGALILWVVNLALRSSETAVEGIVTAIVYITYIILAAIVMIVVAIQLGLIASTAGIYALVLFIMAIILVLTALIIKFLDVVLGVWFGTVEVLKAIFENIKIAWHNMLVGMKESFWLWVNDLINQFKPFLELINKALEAMGEKTIDLNFAANKANEVGGKLEYVNVSDAWDKGYTKGSTIGKGIHDRINGVGDKITNLKKDLEAGFTVDESALTNGKLDDIASDTSDIADAVALSAEDLEYLRRVAAMEWKKEYTTANIVVDMTNNNTISGENDLDGIVTNLSQKLREELGEVANGVYA